MEIILTHPGIHLRGIQKKLQGISIGVLTRNLHTLEKQGKIISKKHKEFDYRCFWIQEHYSKYQHLLIQFFLTKIELKIHGIIKKTPGITQKQILSQIKKIRQPTISYHLNKMKKKKLIISQRMEKTKTYYISKK